MKEKLGIYRITYDLAVAIAATNKILFLKNILFFSNLPIRRRIHDRQIGRYRQI